MHTLFDVDRTSQLLVIVLKGAGKMGMRYTYTLVKLQCRSLFYSADPLTVLYSSYTTMTKSLFSYNTTGYTTYVTKFAYQLKYCMQKYHINTHINLIIIINHKGISNAGIKGRVY